MDAAPSTAKTRTGGTLEHSMSKGTRVVLTAAGIALLMLGGAAWAGQRPGKCIAQARAAHRQCVQSCNATGRSDVTACFGPGSDCAQACLDTDTSCKSGPMQAAAACADDTSNPQSCRSQLLNSLQACKSDPNPQACADSARLAGLQCRQACLDAQKPALQQ